MQDDLKNLAAHHDAATMKPKRKFRLTCYVDDPQSTVTKTYMVMADEDQVGEELRILIVLHGKALLHVTVTPTR